MCGGPEHVRTFLNPTLIHGLVIEVSMKPRRHVVGLLVVMESE